MILTFGRNMIRPDLTFKGGPVSRRGSRRGSRCGGVLSEVRGMAWHDRKERLVDAVAPPSLPGDQQPARLTEPAPPGW